MPNKQTNKPKITFIIPVYNSALYLEECLNSLLNQSIHKEIIIIDDGSSDSSLSIILEYQQKHPEILLIKQPNQGAAAARNKGIALATGEFISFIDSDDFLIGDISPLIQLGKHYNCELIKFGAVLQHYDINQNHKYSYITYIFSEKNSSHSTLFTGYQALFEAEKRKLWIPGCCWTLIKREYLEEYKIRFQENIIAEDQLFYLQLLTKRKDCKIIEAPSIHYIYRRGHIPSVSSRRDKQYVENHLEMSGHIIKYMNTLSNHLNSPILFIAKQLLRTALRIMQGWNTNEIKSFEHLYLNKWRLLIKENYTDLSSDFDNLFGK